MDDLASRVRHERVARKLSQGALGKRVNMSQATIANIERGRNRSSSQIVQLAVALGVSAHWLATGNGDKGSFAPPPPPNYSGKPSSSTPAAADDYSAMLAVMQQVAALPVDKREALYALAGLDKPDAQLADEEKQVLSIWRDIQQRDRVSTIALLERQRDLDLPRTWSVTIHPTGYTRDVSMVWNKETDAWDEVPNHLSLGEMLEYGQPATDGKKESTNPVATRRRKA